MFICENCGEFIDTAQFYKLENNELYNHAGFYIIEKSCEVEIKSEFDNFEIVESTEDLILVHVWDNVEDEE